MRRVTVSVLVVAMVLLPAMNAHARARLSIQLAVVRTAVGATSIELVAPGHLRMSIQENGRTMIIEHIAGAAARKYVDATRAKTGRSSAFRRAERSLARRGYHPAAGMMTITRKYPANNGAIGVTQSFDNEDGEMVTAAWDDGDDGTWEGVISLEDYNTTQWQVWDLQFRIEDVEDLGNNYQSLDGFGVGGGGPWEIDYAAPEAASPAGVVVAAASTWGGSAGSIALSSSGEGAGSVAASAMALGSWGSFWDCVYWGALGAIAACLLTGPGFFFCFAVGIGVVVLVCALREVL